MLLNKARADEILEREGLDGLIALRPINQYYLSDYWGNFNSPVGYEAAYISLYATGDRPSALVLPALEIRRLETTGGTWMPRVYSYTGPADREPFDDGTPHGADYAGWPVRDDAALGALEQQWVDITAQFGGTMSPNAIWALVRAIRAAGLEHGRIATDDNRIAGWLHHCGLDRTQWDYRPQLFNEIRLVKSATELELLRVAARINEAAVLTTIAALREGAEWSELENLYMAEIAQRGGRGVYLMCGLGGLPARTVRRGEPVMFDGLGQYQQYHGDFGRSAVVGEPSAEHRARYDAICSGWKVAEDMIRPGIAYSELSAAIGEAVRREGLRDFRDPVVHSLGLEHTDDPKPPGVQPQTKPDQVLLPDMVLNVDMPHTEIGWGSMHTEDTLRITTHGWEPLTSLDMGLRVLD